MNVVVFGANGFLGRNVLAEALQAGHHVTAFVRRASSITQKHSSLTVVEGNVLDRVDVLRSLQGQDAVIQVLGYNGKGTGRPTTFTADATEIILQAMDEVGIKRIIAMSVAGAGDSITFFPKIVTCVVFPLFMRWFVYIIEDKNLLEQRVMNSNTDWTLVRSITIKDSKAQGKVRATLDGRGMRYSVSVHDVARFLVEQLTSTCFVHQAPTISC